MVNKNDTMPGAIPTRISDDEAVTIDDRSYVATGASVSSTDKSIPRVAPPPHITLPVRAPATSVKVSRGTADGLTHESAHPAVQSVQRLCRLLDGDAIGFLSSEIVILRNDARILAELSQLAEQCLDGSHASRTSPQQTPTSGAKKRKAQAESEGQVQPTKPPSKAAASKAMPRSLGPE